MTSIEAKKTLHVVSFGEALWDLLPDGAVLGGAPLNFAYRVGSLGHKAGLISALGSDQLGDRAMRQIADLGMDTGLIQRRPSLPTGTVAVEVDPSGDPHFTINAPAAYDSIRMDPGLTEAVSAADCLCFGTLIQRATDSRHTLAAVVEAYDRGSVLCDINLRKDCYTEESILRSLDWAQILKINETELPEVCQVVGLNVSGVLDQTEALLEKSGLSCCLVTLGRRGAYAVTREGERVYGPAYRVRKMDAAGSGDACTAGFVHGLLALGDLALACRLGNAMGSAVAGQHGATQPIDRSELARLIDSEDYEEIAPELEHFIQ
jgi:fructokinase